MFDILDNLVPMVIMFMQQPGILEVNLIKKKNKEKKC